MIDQRGRDQRVLAGEVLVEAALGDSRLLADAVDTSAGDSLAIEEVSGSVQQFAPSGLSSGHDGEILANGNRSVYYRS